MINAEQIKAVKEGMAESNHSVNDELFMQLDSLGWFNLDRIAEEYNNDFSCFLSDLEDAVSNLIDLEAAISE